MKRKIRTSIRGTILLVILILIILTIYNTTTNNKVDVLKVGDSAPDFSLVDLNGNPHKLSDYQGKGVLLNFWGTWCDPCKKEMPALEKQYQLFKGKEFEILAINIAQSKFEVSNFSKQYSMTFPVVIDTNKSVMRKYNIDPLPTSIFVNKEGKITYIIKGEMNEQMIKQYIENTIL